MYKILVTTTITTAQGASISVIEISFDVRASADQAMHSINDANRNSRHRNYSQNAMPLYAPANRN